ncbi:MAG: orotidine-5'-phosphate decarboxylase [Granulosicoccus sp.]
MSHIITALDFAEPKQARQLVARLDPKLTRLKIGNQLFTVAGPTLVEEFQRSGFELFLDLKYHDIPNTVASALAAAASLGVWMVNVHAGGGKSMLNAARNAVPAYSEAGGTRLIAVTVLTSLDQHELQGVGLDAEPASQVERLTRLTLEAGLDGVVCSPLELGLVRKIAPEKFLTVTPGVRPDNVKIRSQGGSGDDQRRTMTPAEAVQAGSDYLVIGRPITQASDPLAALNRIHDELMLPTDAVT